MPHGRSIRIGGSPLRLSTSSGLTPSLRNDQRVFLECLPNARLGNIMQLGSESRTQKEADNSSSKRKETQAIKIIHLINSLFRFTYPVLDIFGQFLINKYPQKLQCLQLGISQYYQERVQICQFRLVRHILKLLYYSMNDKFGKNSFFSLPSCDKFPQFNHSLKFINSINAFPSQSCINIENPPEQTPLPPEEDSLAEHLTLLHATSNSTKKKKMGCTCKKTLCLKMYCECFSSGKKCGGDCGCSGCKNLPEFEEDIAVAKTTIKDGGLRNCSLSEKRCNCKKSQCQKRYCECFNSGVGCTEACKCEGCLNNGIDFNHQMKSFDDKIEIEQLLEKKEKKHDFPALVYHSVEDLSRFYS